MTLKLGKKPPHPRHTHPRVTLDSHADWDRLIPAVPPKLVDRTGKLDYPMYGNDRYGDCAEAGAAHMVQSITSWARNLITPSDDDVLSLYTNVTGFDPANPATDNGTNLQDLLGWWSRNGWPGGSGMQLKAFAELRRWDEAAMRACLYYFGTVYVGVQFPNGAMTQFQNGEPWSVIPGDTIDGGHCIVLEATRPGKDEYTWISWGKRQKSNRAWWWKYAEEAWVPVTEQALDNAPKGLDAKGLMSEFKALTGG